MSEQSRLEIVIDSRGAERNLRSVRNELRGVESVGVSSMSAIRSAAMLATGALAAIGVGSGLSSAIADIRDFQTEMSGLRAVTLASAGDMERFETQARQLGATTAFGANQAAQAQRLLAQAGMSVNEVLSSTPAVLQLAQAGMMDLASAADLATDIMGQMGLQVEDIARINDVLVATAQSATTDVSQLGQAFSQAGPIANAFGVSLEDTAAALGVISSSGIKASRAGTGLLGTLRQLGNMTPQAAGALGNYSLSIEDVDVSARGLTPVLRDLAAAQISASDAMQIFGSEAAPAALSLLQGVDAYEQQTQALRDLDGVAANAARTMTDNLGGAIRGLGSAISEANLQLGDSGLSGALSGTVTAATGLVQVFNGMQSEWAEANSISADYVGTLETVASAAQLTAVAVGVRLATALGTATTAKIADTAATIRGARAEAEAARQVTRRTGAELASARALMRTAQLEVAATRNTNAHAFALSALSAARVRATSAAGAHAAATTTAAAAMGRASVAARTLSASMALLGGPVGVALLAAAGIYTFREELGLIPRSARPASEHLEELANRIDGVTDATVRSEIAGFTAELVNLQAEAAEAQQRLERLQRVQSEPASFGQGQQGDLRQGVGQAESDLAEIQNKITARQQAIDTLNEGLTQAGESSGSAGQSISDLGDTVDDVVAKFRPMLDQDIEDILDRAGPGATVDDTGTLRDAWGNSLPTLQRELDAQLQDQLDDFRTEQNLMKGLEAAAQTFIDEAVGAASQAWNSIVPTSAEDAAGQAEQGLAGIMPTGEQSSVPDIARPKNLGKLTIEVSSGSGSAQGDIEGDEAFIARLADALSGASAAR